MNKNEKLTEMKDSMRKSIEEGKVEEFVDMNAEMIADAEQRVFDLYKELKDEKDTQILASRGVYQLTSEEKAFYAKWVENAKNGLQNIPTAIPEVTWMRVFDDLATNHPLLAHVNFINTKAINNNIVTSTGLTGEASWGELCSTITAEIGNGFVARTVSLNKLTAWMPLCLTILELGYEWLDRFVRECLREALALAFEDAILNGDGANKPIGLTKVLADAGETQTIPATAKTAVAITALDIVNLGTVAKALSNNGKRMVQGMVMVVNPLDYYDKVLPAVMMVNGVGQYVNYLPFPVDIVMSVKQAQGKATFFLDRAYDVYAGFGTDGGRIYQSDEYKFLEDLRYYKIKLVAGGIPKDNAVSYVADITNLKPAYIMIKDVNNEI